ncbi:MAG: hypothetical protein ABIR24_08475 [Verrucomicrobiota bacterium]
MNKKIIIVFLLILILGAGAWLYHTQFGQPKIDLNIYQTLGSVTAEETAKLLGNNGDIVVVSWKTHNKSPVVDAQIASLARGIKKHKGLRIAASEKVERDPAQMMATGGAVPTEEFLKIVKAHPEAEAFVLFLAFPNLLPQALETITKGQTKFVVVSGCNPGYKKLLLDRTISLAIVPQFDRTKNTRPPQTSQEVFDQNYLIITPEQANALPY